MSNTKSIVSNSPRLALRFGKWVRGKLTYSNRVIAVSSFEEASRKWEAMRDAANAGASASPIVVVVDLETGEHVAKVCYNGRVMDAEGREIPVGFASTPVPFLVEQNVEAAV